MKGLKIFIVQLVLETKKANQKYKSTLVEINFKTKIERFALLTECIDKYFILAFSCFSMEKLLVSNIRTWQVFLHVYMESCMK